MCIPKDPSKIEQWKINIKNSAKKRIHFPTSEETKKKISKSLMGHGFSLETREKMSKTRTGVKQSIESRIKRSNSLKGHKVSKETRKKIGISNSKSLKGKKLPISVRNKISESMKGINARERNPNWIDGRTPINKLIRQSSEYELWRDAVFTRDNYTDQKTGIRGGKLHPHHILNFSNHPELRFDVNNGITLSEKAHREFHSSYGKKNNTQKQLLEFLSN